MLVLTRRKGEEIFVGDDITIVVLSIQGNRVKIGIDAPSGYHILRGELADEGALQLDPKQPRIQPPPTPAA